MSKKKILVTGGLGFIGSNLVKFLCDNGYNVDVIDNLITGSKNYINNKDFSKTLSKDIFKNKSMRISHSYNHIIDIWNEDFVFIVL